MEENDHLICPLGKLIFFTYIAKLKFDPYLLASNTRSYLVVKSKFEVVGGGYLLVCNSSVHAFCFHQGQLVRWLEGSSSVSQEKTKGQWMTFEKHEITIHISQSVIMI